LFDIDHSGTITVDEIKKILGAGAKDIDEGEWDRILDEVDEDGNGEISFEEFRCMIYNLFGMEVDKKIR
jgi:Ca2+-binding EF-hand superfamily protein